jgi:hypothetical protein
MALKNFLEFVFYIDGSVKHQETLDAIMESAILLIFPIRKSFNFMIKENISVFIAELFPILVILMLVPNCSKVEINTDSNIIYINFNK